MWVRKQEGCLWRWNWKESLFPRAGTPGWPQVGAWRKSFVETLHTGAQGGEKLIPNENPQKIQELSLKTNKWGWSTDQASGLQGTPGRAGWGPGGIFTAAAGARGPRKGQNWLLGWIVTFFKNFIFFDMTFSFRYCCQSEPENGARRIKTCCWDNWIRKTIPSPSFVYI